MIRLKEIVDALSAAEAHVPSGWEALNVQGVFASDLISDILVSDGEETLLLTSLQSDQVLRTADVIGATAVVIVNRSRVSESLAKGAVDQGLPLFFTSLSKFDACVRLGQIVKSA